MAKHPLEDFVSRHGRLFVLTGAGCSTNSGIPDYRDSHGNWKRTQPVNFQAFMSEEHTRRRYWARSLIGWRRFGSSHHLEQAEAMLIVGSSLMVYSGFRFVQAAARRQIPIAAVNLGRTRADDLLTLKVEERCETALAFLL